MLDPTPEPVVPVESARALCGGCGGPLAGRQKVACSGKCRAILSRLRRNRAAVERDKEVRAALEAIAGLVQRTLERHGWEDSQ
jgi:hypothetical protein